MRHLLIVFLLLFIDTPAVTQSAPNYDLVVYGGTAAAVTAAVQAKIMGKTVIIVSPDKHLGGLSSGGLGFTDTGDKAVIGRLAPQVFHRVWERYDPPAGWEGEEREGFWDKGQGTPAIYGGHRAPWSFD